jgi:hypothetical protein
VKDEMILRMRDEYAALVRVADGLMDMLRGNCPCNMLTFARMAEQARQAARSIASMIERLLVEEKPTPQKRRRLREAVKSAIRQLQAFAACL